MDYVCYITNTYRIEIVHTLWGLLQYIDQCAHVDVFTPPLLTGGGGGAVYGSPLLFTSYGVSYYSVHTFLLG